MGMPGTALRDPGFAERLQSRQEALSASRMMSYLPVNRLLQAHFPTGPLLPAELSQFGGSDVVAPAERRRPCAQHSSSEFQLPRRGS